MRAVVIVPEIYSSSFRRSDSAARGSPQLATWTKTQKFATVKVKKLTGPQKCVPVDCKQYLGYGMGNILKKYSRAAGERTQVKNVEAIVVGS
jgi:hypothetical protein